MFSLNNQLQLRKVTVSSLITCIYLPTLVSVVSYFGLLYNVGEPSSSYILGVIFLAESLKALYLYIPKESQNRKSKSRNISLEIFRSVAFLLFAVCSYFVFLILFGGPFLEKQQATLMLSCLMTLLTVYPLVALVGDIEALQLLFKIKSVDHDEILKMHINNIVLTICGTWLGSVVAPLDWQKPWQEWPIPCYLGTIGGYLLSNVLNVLKVSLMSGANRYGALKILLSTLNKLEMAD